MTTDPNEPRHQHQWSYRPTGEAVCEWCRHTRPAPSDINALPDSVRRYIHDLETMVDPAGLVRENVVMRDAIPSYAALLATRDREMTELQAALAQAHATIEVWQREAQSAREESDSIHGKALRWAANLSTEEAQSQRAMYRTYREDDHLVWAAEAYAKAAALEQLADRIARGPGERGEEKS